MATPPSLRHSIAIAPLRLALPRPDKRHISWANRLISRRHAIYPAKDAWKRLQFFLTLPPAPAPPAAVTILGSSGSWRAMSVSSRMRISLVVPSIRTMPSFRLLMMPTILPVRPLSGPFKMSTCHSHHNERTNKQKRIDRKQVGSDHI